MGQVMQIHGGDVYSLAATRGWPEDRILDFSASINPLGLSPRAVSAIEKKLGVLDRYPDPNAWRLTGCLANLHGVQSDSLLIGNGSTELIHLITRATRPRTVVIASPTFGEYERASRLSGARIRFVAPRTRDELGIDLQAFYKAGRDGADLVFLCNPNNPTGGVIDREKVRWLIKKLSPHTLVAIDEAFIDYCPEHSALGAQSKSRSGNGACGGRENLVILRSFTKFFALAGLRVGYLVAHPDLVRRLKREKEPWTVNTLAQTGAIESLQDSGYAQASLRYMQAERPRFSTAMGSVEGLNCHPSSSNFFLVSVKGGPGRASALYRELSERGILVRNCASFRALGAGYMRVAVRKPEENEALLKTLRQCAPGVSHRA